MARHFNMLVPLACPHCLTELLVTLEQVQDEESVQCARCGTVVALQPEDLPVPLADLPESTDFLRL